MLGKDALLASGRKANPTTVDLPSGGQVAVRALTRGESLEVSERASGDYRLSEAIILHHGLVDPRLTEEEAAEWIAVAPAGDVGPVVDEIARLSGMKEGSGKTATKSVARPRKRN